MISLFRQRINTFTRAAASPSLLMFALPWLMVLLVLGTVAQRYIGLYPAQKLFFGSFLLWLGPMPLPGAYTVLALIAFSLVVKLALYSPLEKRQLGIIITHISALILFAGGLVSTLAREEGYIVLMPGDISDVVSDYHQRALTVTKNGKFYAAVPYDNLAENNPLPSLGLPFSVYVKHLCYPCAPKARIGTDGTLRGVAQKVDLAQTALSTEDADNQPGIVFVVEGSQKGQDGPYIAFENLAQQPVIMQGGDTYEIRLRPTTRSLPFSVKLLHFEKADYPGTDMARAYQSEVAVKDGNIEWNATIEMNQPLRYRGYTLYQSSFGDNDGKVYTVLAVVKNVGQWFPYISIAALCAGLLLHMFLRLKYAEDA